MATAEQVEALQEAIQLLDAAYRKKIEKLKTQIEQEVHEQRKLKQHQVAEACLQRSPSSSASSTSLLARKTLRTVRTKLSETGKKLESIEPSVSGPQTPTKSLEKLNMMKLAAFDALYRDLLTVCYHDPQLPKAPAPGESAASQSVEPPPPPPPPPPTWEMPIYKPQRWHKISHSNLDPCSKIVRGARENAIRSVPVDFRFSPEQAAEMAAAFGESLSLFELLLTAEMEATEEALTVLVAGALNARFFAQIALVGVRTLPTDFSSLLHRAVRLVVEQPRVPLDLRLLGPGLASTSTLRVLSLNGSELVDDSFDGFIEGLTANTSLVQLELRTCSLHDEHVVRLGRALQNNPIQYLDLADNCVGPAGIASFAQDVVAGAQALEFLDVSSNPLGPEGGIALTNAIRPDQQSALKSLLLQNTGLGPRGGAAIAQMLKSNASLRELRLWGNEFGDEASEAFAEALRVNQTLQVLVLRGNLFSRRASCIFEAVCCSGSSALSHLDFGGNPDFSGALPDVAQSFRKSSSSFALARLDLDGNNHGDLGIRALASVLGDNATLTTLNLSLNGITNTGLLYLSSTLAKNAKLTNLNLAWNHIGTAGARTFAEKVIRPSPENHSCLASINLEGNNVGVEGIAAVTAALASNTQIKSLNISGNMLRHEGVIAVARLLETNKGLTHLYLRNNGIKDQSAVTLAASLKRSEVIEALDISENLIGSSGAAALSEAVCLNNSLLFLDVSENRLGSDARDNLKNALFRNTKLQIIF